MPGSRPASGVRVCVVGAQVRVAPHHTEGALGRKRVLKYEGSTGGRWHHGRPERLLEQASTRHGHELGAVADAVADRIWAAAVGSTQVGPTDVKAARLWQLERTAIEEAIHERARGVRGQRGVALPFQDDVADRNPYPDRELWEESIDAMLGAGPIGYDFGDPESVVEATT